MLAFFLALLSQDRFTALNPVIASEAKQSILSSWRDGLLRFARNDVERSSLLQQRVHMLDRINKIFLEFLHHGAGGFDAVDQADALADKITHEVACLSVAGRRRAIDRVEGVAADDG